MAGDVQVVPTTELETAEISMQVSTAKKYPRNIKAAVASAKDLATVNRQVAQSCIYCRPVGKRNGIQNFAEGGSIRLAEIMQSQWGNIRIGSRTLGVKDGKLLVQGVCHDLEKNVYFTAEVAKSVKRRDGTLYSDGQIEVVNMAGQAIARRNAAFSVIPKALIDDVLESVKDVIVGDKVETAWEQAKKVFKQMGASVDDLLTVLDCSDESKVDKDSVVKLHGIYNAITDNLCGFEDVFGHSPKNEKKGGPTETMAAGAASNKKSAAAQDKTPVQAQSPIQKYNVLAIRAAQLKGKKFLEDLVGAHERFNKKPFVKFDDATLNALNDQLEKVVNE